MASVDGLLDCLRALPSRDGLMNPYASARGSFAPDSRDEIGEQADALRCANLAAYLHSLLEVKADVVLCGEAPSYQGCRYTGIAFTSEIEIAARLPPLRGCQLLPAARNGVRPLMREPSAQAVWHAIRMAPKPFVLWNAVQLHPHPEGTARQNRRPTGIEVQLGRESLSLLLELVQPRLVVAVGRTAERALQSLGIEAPYVRHPAHGGRTEFFAGLEALGLVKRREREVTLDLFEAECGDYCLSAP